MSSLVFKAKRETSKMYYSFGPIKYNLAHFGGLGNIVQKF